MNFNIPNFNINLPNFKGKQPISQSLNPLSFKSQQPQNDTFELSVGYINDTHGQANNMMRILSGIKGDLRLSGGDNDIGDEKNKAVHKMTAKFLNLAKITASAFGNHELDTTQADFIDNMAMTEGTYLSANFKKNDAWEELEDNLEEYGRAGVDKELEKSKIVEVKGEKIGLVGASPQDMFDRTTHPLYHKDCKVDSLEETIEDIQEEVNDLKEKGINKIFLLSHLGYKKDQTVAQKTKGIDVIIGGHTHELIRDIKEGDNLFYSKDNEPVIITQAGKNGNYFGELNLTFDKDGVITKAQNNIAETDLFKKNLVALLVIRYHFALQRHRKLLDNRGIDHLRAHGRKARFGKFVRLFIARYNAHIVARHNLFRGRHTYGKGLRGEDVFRGFVSLRNANSDVVIGENSAPCSIHRIGLALLVVCRHNQHRHRIKPRF